MRRPLLATTVLFLSLSLAPADRHPAQGPGSRKPGALVHGSGAHLWLVELSSPPLAGGGTLAGIHREHREFRAAAARLRYTERRAFETLWNGLSVAVHPDDLDALRRMPGVAEIYPILPVELSAMSPTVSPHLTTARSMTGVDVVQSRLGYTGQGIRLGVIDSGVDYDHASLGGDGVARSNSDQFPNGRVVTGYDLVGDAYTGENDPVPDPYPDDCAGHGTHVSGIVGANGEVTGVAPEAMLGAYRVFGCMGSSTTDVIIEAMEMALADGMQVVNMSIGDGPFWPSYPLASAADRLVNQGVVVVTSTGNGGLFGLYYITTPAAGRKVISVASFENTQVHRAAFSMTPDDYLVYYHNVPGVPAAPLGGTLPLARTGSQTTQGDACQSLPSGSLDGHLALIRDGGCFPHQKALNAMNAGAAAVILYSRDSGEFTLPSVDGTPPITIPVVTITRANGHLMDDRLAMGPVDATWGKILTTPSPEGGRIMEESSYGMSPDLSIKPDIGAPGGNIRSTYPLELGSFINFSGTSMSSPHVAGAVALLLEAAPNTPPALVREILQNNAEPRLWFGDSGLGLLEVVHRQGAGMLRIDRAILSTTLARPGKLSLGEIESGPMATPLTIENRGELDRIYTLSHRPALATGPDTFSPAFFIAPSSVTFSENPVAVGAGDSATVDVTIAPDNTLAERSLFGGYIRVTADDGSGELNVPYAGFKGDYQGFPILLPTLFDYPWLARPLGMGFENLPKGATFTMVKGDRPYIVYYVDHHASLVEMVVRDLNGASFHRAYRAKDEPRSQWWGPYTVFNWDGTTTNGNKTFVVPNGDYRITLQVVRPLGDPDNPDHVESWTSPVITLARP